MSNLLPFTGVETAEGQLVPWVVSKVRSWENQRNIEFRRRWQEYYRLWKGIWAPEDRDRASERSHAIMPAIAQAVESAVSEQEEATFGRERWIDVEGDRDMADRVLRDMRVMQAEVSKTFLLGAIYGTGIAKLIITEDEIGDFAQTLKAIEPFQFVIDPASETIHEALGVAHLFTLPLHLVEQRQRQGIYADVDPGTMPESLRPDWLKLDQTPISETDAVSIIEWHGKVPRAWLPKEDRPPKGKQLAHEQFELTEAIVTIANDNVLLKAAANPLEHQDRAFVAYQHDTVPGKFWGRGVVEKGYWPQKVLDAEIRSRIDALGLSTHPMLAVNAAAIQRGETYEVRPGRTIFLNGDVSSSITPLKLPPPDPQTYTQSSEMQRMVEMATGQLQAATPIGVNARNSTASGMSMILGAAIRRTKRTMANIERDFLRPLVRKVIWRGGQFDFNYEQFNTNAEFKVYGTLGIMAREFEQVQLTQMLNSLPPGPEQLMVLRAVVDNSSLVHKEQMIQLVDALIEKALTPVEPEPDLGGQARMLAAQARLSEVQANAQLAQMRTQLETQELQLKALEAARNHERGMTALAVDAEKADTDRLMKSADSVLSLAKAEAEEPGDQMAEYRDLLSQIVATLGEQGVLPPKQAEKVQQKLEPVFEADDLASRVRGIQLGRDDDGRVQTVNGRRVARNPGGGLPGQRNDISGLDIETDATGLVTRVNGRNVVRDESGLIKELR